MESSVKAYMKSLAILGLSLAGNDVSDFESKFKQWSVEAEPFMAKLNVLRKWKAHILRFLKSDMELFEEEAAALSADFKEAVKKIINIPEVPQEAVAFIKDVNLYLRKDSAPAWSRIAKNVAMLGEPRLAIAFLPDEEGEDSPDLNVQNAMKALVKKLTGRSNDAILTLNEMRDFRETNERDIAKYSELRKEFVAQYKNALLRFVRSSGKETIDVAVAAKFLNAKGCNYIPKGFIGKIDELGRLYTVAGKQIAGMLIGEVKMNPRYDPKLDNTYVCYLASNPAQQLRTVTFNAKNKAARFEKVNNFIDKVDDHRKSWVDDLRSLDDKKVVLSAMVETIYQTQARIGGDSTNMEGEDRYGMSTLLMKHIKMLPNGGIYFKYPGKKGTVQEHELNPKSVVTKRVISIIKGLTKNKHPDDHVFTYRGKALNGSDVNRYLRSLGIDVSIHKFRHLAGTKLAMQILKRSAFKKGAATQAQVEKWVKEEFKEIGQALHHRSGTGEKEKVVSSTAIAAYVDPAVLKNYFTGLGLRVPKWVPKI